MSCFSALQSQILTFLLTPQEVIFLKHKVFREYAKVTVGPDFIHTLPSFIILITLIIIFRTYRVRSKRLLRFSQLLHNIVQVFTSWICINAVFWLWLICQQILYCTISTYWSHETEFREISFPWWHFVWSSYYPPPTQPPVLSSSFISWIICITFATTTFLCTTSIPYITYNIVNTINAVQEAFRNIKYNWIIYWRKLLKITEYDDEAIEVTDKSEWSSISGDCHSEIGNGDIINTRNLIHPVSCTNWTEKANPNPTAFKEAFSKFSARTEKSTEHTFTTTVGDVANQKKEKVQYSPRQLRRQRGCRT